MYKLVVKEIKKAKSIYIATHVNPDGDAIGSSMALYLALKEMGKDVKVILPSYADIFDTLPYLNEVVNKVEKEQVDLLIFLDSSDQGRIAINPEDIKKAKKTICIDHHKTSVKYTDISVVDEKSPATAELIFNLLKALKVNINKDIATHIYAGILTDTGSFKYSSTRPETFKIASELIETGIDFSKIARNLLDTYKKGKLKLIGKYVDKIEEIDEKIFLSEVSLAEIKSLGLTDEDAEGMANYGLMVKEVEVSIYIREKEDGTFKVSMRSKGIVDLAKVALLFGGGGHQRAAGCSFTKEEYPRGREELLKVIKENLDL